jgi:outer membrane protein TolC
VKLANASFNNLLRREINAPLKVVDILEYQPSLLRPEECHEQSFPQRPEVKIAALNVYQAREEVKIAKSGHFPAMDLTASYDRLPEKSSLSREIQKREL